MQLVSKISNLCGPDPPTSHTVVTDRRHGGRPAIAKVRDRVRDRDSR